MIRISVIAARNIEKSLTFLAPLLVNRRRLKELGIEFRVFTEGDTSLYDADCVFFHNRVFREWGSEVQDQKAFSLLETLNRRVSKVFWFDTNGGTGATQFQFLPYVDGYFKYHILKDKSEYTRTFYGGRSFTDYYHREFGVNDSREFQPMPASAQYLDKIQLGWSYSLYDYGRWARYLTKLRNYVPLPMFYTQRFVRPLDRPITACFRFGTKFLRETVAFQRHLLEQAAQQLGYPTERLSRPDYLRELRRSKMAVSPFGWAEPSYKDFETIINGAALVKPDVSHMATWPDLYRAGETYLPVKWDCSDLEAVMEFAVADDKWREIAIRAQDLYSEYLFGTDGREEFCNRILGIVQFEVPSS